MLPCASTGRLPGIVFRLLLALLLVPAFYASLFVSSLVRRLFSLLQH